MVRCCTLLVLFVCASNASAADDLVNGGFEDARPTWGWEVTTYGAQPSFALDAAISNQGQTALVIFAGEPSDTALAQEVTLKPKHWYRFSAFVRTEQLDPHGSAVSATLQVQKPKGAGLIAAGPSRIGHVEWTNTAVWFQAPPDGRVRLCLFFVGFGRGTGAVWFDDARVEETNLVSAPIRITREPLVEARINPMQYGQFVEYLCDLVPSMWAEKLYDGSFEGLSPYKFAFIKQTDFKEKPWYPSGAVNRGRYTLEKETKVSGEVSQKIEVIGAEPCTLGLSQDGIFVERGQACDFSCWLRATGLRGTVRIKLHREGKVYASCNFSPTGDWQKFRARLRPAARDENATLTVEFRGPGTLWIDNASLMPVETIGGWRPDVVEAVRALRPHIIRFGGSALDEPGFGEFEWKNTIGDPDHRKPFRAWGGLQPTGPGLEEFVQFCQAVNAEPMICVRFSGRTPKDAADEVEYFNGAAATVERQNAKRTASPLTPALSPLRGEGDASARPPAGASNSNTRMGALRARNGHPQPYGVKYWQVGNERQSREYDEDVAEFCQAMKAVDPKIRLLSSFPTAGSLRNAGAYFDYVCPHHYTPNLMECESSLNSIRALLKTNAQSRSIKVAVTEWNTTAGDWGVGRATLMTLGNALACSRYHNLLHRNCDLVEIANRSNLINSFGSGIIQVDNHRLYKTPTYYAQWLYANLAGDRALRIESSALVNLGLDLSATLNEQRGEVVFFVVNLTDEEIARPVDFSAFGNSGQRMMVWTLADRERAGEADVRNGFGDPERVSARESMFRAKASKFEYRFPALSLTVLRWRASR